MSVDMSVNRVIFDTLIGLILALVYLLAFVVVALGFGP